MLSQMPSEYVNVYIHWNKNLMRNYEKNKDEADGRRRWVDWEGYSRSHRKPRIDAKIQYLKI